MPTINLAVSAAALAVLALAPAAQAQTVSSDATFALAALVDQQTAPVTEPKKTIESLIAEQTRRIADQEKAIAAQRLALDVQAQELARLKAETAKALEDIRGAGQAPVAVASAPVTQGEIGLRGAQNAWTLEEIRGAGPGDPPLVVAQAAPVVGERPTRVGEAPPEPEPVELASLPEGTGVLTPPGKLTFEPFFDFSHGSSNRLVFRGVEIVTGIQIGVIEASDADRDTLVAGGAYRIGLTDRLELEARVPFVSRSDRVTTLVQMDEAVTRTFKLKGQDIGDVEAAIRYQLNSGANGAPVFIGGLRVKSDTGTNPLEIERDEFGIATELATGSGFWAVEPSVSFLYPLDPVVLFGSVGYLAHLKKDINQTIGGVLIGEVDPGDTLSAGAGFGFALNPRFSFSLGYKHAYIWPTVTELGGTRQESHSLQVGAFTFGWSLRLSERTTLSNAYEVGTTSDSPDMRVVFRLPYRF